MDSKAQKNKKTAPKPLNVLELMNFAAPYPGNFFRCLTALEQEISARGGSVVYVMPERAAGLDWVEREIRLGRNICFLPQERLKAAKILADTMKSRRVNIVHSHFIDAGMYIPLRLARLRYRGAAHIFHAHSIPSFNTGSPVDLLRRFLLNAKIHVCVSGAVAEVYSKAHRKCVTVINAIDFSRLEKAVVPEKESVKGSNEKKALLMFGYDFAIKGIDTVLKSLETYDSKHNYTVMICSSRGVENAAAQVRQTLGDVPDWVELLPPTDNIAAYYSRADAFVSASRREGFGYAVVEAAVMNLPLVLSSIPAHRELALPHAGYFETDNIRELYDTLEVAFTKNAEKTTKETTENAVFARDRFGIDRWVTETVNLLEKTN